MYVYVCMCVCIYTSFVNTSGSVIMLRLSDSKYT